MTIRYTLPKNWIAYDHLAILETLTEAKAAILALTQFPFQRSWADKLQIVQLKREVAGTSRIEGADFTERELDEAMSAGNAQTAAQLETRSQRQAAAATATYRWIATLTADKPVDEALISEIHRRLVTGCDDDHCQPGAIRKRDQNGTFGIPRHRGADGGAVCEAALGGLVGAARGVFHEHDPLVQALALHYHFAAMHPFLDGNGRTARALEAFMLRRTGLRDTLFIAMSNYYYEEKAAYLDALGKARAAEHDLTPFLNFALKGISRQCHRLFGEIRQQIKKALFRDMMSDLFGRLESKRKRVLSERHGQLLNLFLEKEKISLSDVLAQTKHLFRTKNVWKTVVRDLNYLIRIRALLPSKEAGSRVLEVNLDWPAQITETEFFRRVRLMPKSKVYPFLSR
ncbi:MAG: Fic family protein [Puniceicoccales bacterium]|jgi:Fic family protein|nr:Fic family protein [Puniceicoccales bacterium]